MDDEELARAEWGHYPVRGIDKMLTIAEAEAEIQRLAATRSALAKAVELADYYASGGSPDSCGFAAELHALVSDVSPNKDAPNG